jgi:hypothetical protein
MFNKTIIEVQSNTDSLSNEIAVEKELGPIDQEIEFFDDTQYQDNENTSDGGEKMLVDENE